MVWLVRCFFYVAEYTSDGGKGIIEDAIRRRHSRPRIWGSAGCGLFCMLWWVNVRRWVGTVVDLQSSWQVLRGVWYVLDSFFTISTDLVQQMLRLLAFGFVVDHFGDLQIYNFYRGHYSSKGGMK